MTINFKESLSFDLTVGVFAFKSKIPVFVHFADFQCSIFLEVALGDNLDPCDFW